jgi:DNA-binding SARP family transcriptional activator
VPAAPTLVEAATSVQGGFIMMPTTSPRPEILVSVLGAIRLSVHDEVVPVASGSKSEQYLGYLALERHRRLPRSDILEHMWPGQDHAVSGQCLNSLTHQLNKSVGRCTRGVSLVVQQGGFYRLNPAKSVAVDVDLFDRWRERGMRLLRRGDADGIAWCTEAMGLYRGELCAGASIDALSERERLRAAFLDLLATVADHHLAAGDPEAALRHIERLLGLDYCREDAHRQAMRCHMQLGHRSQALRQFRLCCDALDEEFDALPEPETVALYDLIRREPAALLP